MNLEIIGTQAPKGTYDFLCEVSREGSFYHISTGEKGQRRFDVFLWPLEQNGHKPSAVFI